MTTAFISHRVSLKDVGISLFVSFFGNLAGSLFFMALIMGLVFSYPALPDRG